MTLNDLERRNSPYFVLFFAEFDRFSCRLYHSGPLWLEIIQRFFLKTTTLFNAPRPTVMMLLGYNVNCNFIYSVSREKET